ncbi:MAG: caspase family protein [Bacteroidales bacterium]|nr:caspase family protein [Bacteroidales bacterium]MBD5282969.1 caspase family protein [Bacteroides sp.]
MKRFITALCIILTSLLIAHAETYVVCVGIANYADPKVKNLTKTEADAKAMAAFYKKATDNVITITGKYASKSRILNSIRSQFARAGADDKIVFYFSGHGYPGGFCPYDMLKLDDGIKYSDIISIMQKSRAGSKFIFADACHSGAIRKEGQGSDINSGNVLLFLSSRGNELSAESPFMANGFFTKHLIRGLGGGADSDKDRRITAKELFDYVSKGVKSQTNNRQHPVMWGSFDDNLTIVEYRKK